MNTGHVQACVALRFFLPPPSLRPFVSTLYHMEISGADPQPIEDWLHPEWANLRIIPDRTVAAGIGGMPLQWISRAVVVVPTSVATLFRALNGRSRRIGLIPSVFHTHLTRPVYR